MARLSDISLKKWAYHTHTLYIHMENDAGMLVVKKSWRGRLIGVGFCIKSIGYIIRGMKKWSLKGLVFKRDFTLLKTNSLCPFTKQDSILSIPEF